MTNESNGGPYVGMATFCEEGLQEKGGVPSLSGNRTIDNNVGPGVGWRVA